MSHNQYNAFLKDLKKARWLAVLFGIFLLGMVFSFLSPAFLQFRNLENIAVQSAVTGVMAVGMTFVIMTSGIDISVGAILYLAVALTAEIAVGGHPYLAYLMGIGVGFALGMINGLITNGLKINPLVTTLATMTIYRGLAIHVNKARITIMPEISRFFGTGKVLDIPMPIIIAIVAVIIGVFIIKYTRFGRYVLAIGSSEQSARETDLPVFKTLIFVYAIAGFCAGLAAMILVGRVGAVQSDMGIGIEFTVITAVVLGGTSLSGGQGSIVGSLLGAIFLIMIDNGLNLINASPFIYDVVRGTVLIGAIIIDRVTQVKKSGATFANFLKYSI